MPQPPSNPANAFVLLKGALHQFIHSATSAHTWFFFFFFFFYTWFFLTPLLCLKDLPQTLETEPQTFLSTPPDQPPPITLRSQHLFLLCKKTSKRHCWETSENQQESMQHCRCRYFPDGNLISGNKQNPEGRKHPQPLSHWIFTQHRPAHTHSFDSAHFMQKPFPTEPMVHRLNHNSRPWRAAF